jgi:hypothetical protein
MQLQIPIGYPPSSRSTITKEALPSVQLEARSIIPAFLAKALTGGTKALPNAETLARVTRTANGAADASQATAIVAKNPRL